MTGNELRKSFVDFFKSKEQEEKIEKLIKEKYMIENKK